MHVCNLVVQDGLAMKIVYSLSIQTNIVFFFSFEKVENMINTDTVI